MKLTERQLSIVQLEKTTNNPKVACLASAGSGKSTVVQHRVSYLVNELGVDPKKIGLFSFSRTATKEIRDRLQIDLSTQDYKNLTISTLHSFCYSIVAKYIVKGNLEIMQTPQLVNLCKAFIENSKDSAIQELKASSFVNSVESVFRDNSSLMELSAAEYSLWQKIRTWMDKRNFYLFSELLYYSFDLLKKNQRIREKYQENFDYWFFDEAQDTTKVVIDILNLLIKPSTNLFLSFDIIQSLYMFAGADPFYLMNFCNQHNMEILHLDETFRFGETISKYADKIVKTINIDDKYKLFTKTKQTSEDVVFSEVQEKDSVSFVCDDIEKLVKEGVTLSDINVLCRINKQLIFYQKELAKRGINSKLRFGYLWNRPEIKLLLTLLKLNYRNNKDDLMYVMKNLPKNYSIDKSRAKMMYSSYKSKEVIPFLRYFLDNKVAGVGPVIKNNIKNLCDLFQKIEVLVKNESSMFFIDLANLININEAAFMQADYTKDNINNKEERWEFIEILDILRSEKECSLIEFDNMLKLEFTTEDVNTKDAVNLKTIHSSKGETLPYVYLLLDEFSSRFINTDIEYLSELFILYVAVTRAKHKLNIICKNFENHYLKFIIDDELEKIQRISCNVPEGEEEQNLLEEVFKRGYLRGNIIKSPVHVPIVSVLSETPKAFKVVIKSKRDDLITFWMPKSRMKVVNNKIYSEKWLLSRNGIVV